VRVKVLTAVAILAHLHTCTQLISLAHTFTHLLTCSHSHSLAHLHSLALTCSLANLLSLAHLHNFVGIKAVYRRGKVEAALKTYSSVDLKAALRGSRFKQLRKILLNFTTLLFQKQCRGGAK